ncbi:hypothetical protein M2282_000687 [Variovorax boronicumulans]|uniref:type I restriction endonuclease subunit M n=1 Tax=Variovorax boronicumulans TaxID=436515 RepID=UPI002473495E|nr:type I restriction endonuclease subunit M [Variovorax boronicumulans]MDH6165559.1 hypothetical protein [Variovorax boronicumulans]
MKNFLYGYINPNSKPRFALGRVVATPGAIELMQRTETNPFALLGRHVTGDWGECDPEDAQTNEDALTHGSRVLSVYRLPLRAAGEKGDTQSQADLTGDRIWVITEADRSVSTLLLPEEY